MELLLREFNSIGKNRTARRVVQSQAVEYQADEHDEEGKNVYELRVASEKVVCLSRKNNSNMIVSKREVGERMRRERERERNRCLTSKTKFGRSSPDEESDVMQG